MKKGKIEQIVKEGNGIASLPATVAQDLRTANERQKKARKKRKKAKRRQNGVSSGLASAMHPEAAIVDTAVQAQSDTPVN